MPVTQPAVSVQGLRKRYAGRREPDSWALDGLDLEVPAGSVCALLGPNGAGKTTAVRILATLLRYDAGLAMVAGHDVAREPREVRRRIGLVGQHAAVDEILTGRQNLQLFGRLFHLSRRDAAHRAAELLDQLDLADAGDRPVRTYSGGMRRRVDIAASLVLAPGVLFLDEPTTGLDPRGRNEVWATTRELVAAGTTVLLTTQYLEEADRLADQVVVMDAGRVVANGTPEALKTALGADRLEVVVSDPADLARAVVVVERATGTAAHVEPEARRVSASIRDRVRVLAEVLRALDDEQLEVEDVAVRRPTLDEVFLQLTGSRVEAAA